MLFRILLTSSWQFYRQHPAQLLLSMLGILLGVAIVTAVLVTNQSSQKAFALSTQALYGSATHQLSGANGLEQTQYVSLRKQFSHLSMAPVVAGHVALDDKVYSVLGLDPFAEATFNRLGSIVRPTDSMNAAEQSDNTSSGIPISALLENNALIVSQYSVDEDDLRIGAELVVTVGSKEHTVKLAATYTSDNPSASTGLMIGDIALVQQLMGRDSKIDRVDLILDEQQANNVRASLPDALQLTTAASRTQTMQAMTRGFHINLTAMSLLALVVGAFLIHNTMTFAVVQRRQLFAIKRITGISANTLLISILIEALIISFVASLAGVALGYGLSSGLIQLTTRTINDLYFTLHVQDIWFSPWLIVAGLTLGVGSSLLAATLAAADAASTSPVQARQRSVLEARTHRLLPIMATIGFGISLMGLLLSILPSQSLILGFVAMMLLILGYGLLIPWSVYVLTRFIKPWLDKLGVSVSLAVGGVSRNISRTGLAIAALSIAVSATFGVDIMIGSFRTTVDQWLGTTLQSDIYITSPSSSPTEPSQFLNADSRQIAQTTAGVKSVSSGRVLNISTSVGDIDMLVIHPHSQSNAGFELIETASNKPWLDWRNDRTLMISEPLATKHSLEAGGVLELFTEQEGFITFSIAGVFLDYGSSHGKLLMHRQVFDQLWNEPDIGSLGVLMDDTAQEQVLMDALRKNLSTAERPLIIQSNAAIHRQSLVVFDRTFEVTRVLRWLTVGVAFVGIFSALLALHLERAREFAILRASGATRQRIVAVVVLQTLLMGLLAGLLALPLGWLMSEVLIKVINVRSFGWSMQSILPLGAIPETLFLATLSAFLAGIYPALRLSRRGIAAQLRED